MEGNADKHHLATTQDIADVVSYISRMPAPNAIAHGDGRYTADQQTVDRLEGEGRVVLRYIGGPGDADEWWSPNGSTRAIAGIVNDAGNVLGMMPHPERAVDQLLGSSDGLGIFESVLARVTA